MPITDSITIGIANAEEANGNKGNTQRITANKPILTITPLSTIVVAVGACSYASGCQVCKGKMGILIAKAIKNKMKGKVS
jgi:hypothetical protein